MSSLDTILLQKRPLIQEVPVHVTGTEWNAWGDETDNKLLRQEAIFPLIRDIGDGAIPFDEDVETDTTSHSPLSAVVFSGNSTRMDLGGTGTSTRIPPGRGSKTAMSLSILLCDPQYIVRRANVTLSNGKLNANILPTLPRIGNFPDPAADALFSQALLDTLGPEDENPDRLLNPISMLLFTGGLSETGPLRPYSLPVINENMNRVIKSAAKAYLSGYNSSPTSRLPSYALWNQTATVQDQQIALVASKPFFIAVMTLVAVTVMVLMVLSTVIDIREVRLFNLQTLEKVYTDELFTKDD